jgi:hypothetical protein
MEYRLRCLQKDSLARAEASRPERARGLGQDTAEEGRQGLGTTLPTPPESARQDQPMSVEDERAIADRIFQERLEDLSGRWGRCHLPFISLPLTTRTFIFTRGLWGCTDLFVTSAAAIDQRESAQDRGIIRPYRGGLYQMPLRIFMPAAFQPEEAESAMRLVLVRIETQVDRPLVTRPLMVTQLQVKLSQ